MEFLRYKYNNLYPVFAIFSGLLICIFALVYANHIECLYFLISVYLFSFFFIDYKKCIKVLLFSFVLGAIFFVVAFLVSGVYEQGVFMVNRILAFSIGMLPGFSIGAERLARNLSSLRAPRSLTIGMLIAFSFMPILAKEVKRVKEAMKTRGSFNFLNPKIIYRAFLIPFITRIVDISDTLSLSIETRGFSLEDKNYTVYKKEHLRIYDFIYFAGIVLTMVLVIGL